ncbi:MAG: protein-L-isoaspartate(D-aspartate) O-methyltransferase [Thermoleophilaceae bacterium]
MTRRGSETTSTDDEHAKRRARMVERQLRGRGIEDEAVLKAMGEVPRERFVPSEQRRRAYRDGALPIGEKQTISQPWVVARMTELLELEGEERVLEVGTGSGYGAAVLSRCSSHVVTIERHPALAARARETLAELGYRNVEVREGDGTRGVPDRAPFDGISVTATASGDAPPDLRDQLAPGAPLVCPLRRRGGGHRVGFRGGVEEGVGPGRFVPLVTDSEEEPPTE